MKNFGDIKNIRRFAVLSILKGGTTRHKLTGIFCALLLINFGFACPINSRVNSLSYWKVKGIAKPLNTTVSTPVWSVNAPTAFEVDSNGKAEPFLFSAKRTNFTVMLSTEKDCSNGITTPHKTRTPTKRASSTKSTERLLKQLTDKVITLQRDNEEKDRRIDYLNYYIAKSTPTMFSCFEENHPIDSQDWKKLYKMQCQLNNI